MFCLLFLLGACQRDKLVITPGGSARTVADLSSGISFERLRLASWSFEDVELLVILEHDELHLPEAQVKGSTLNGQIVTFSIVFTSPIASAETAYELGIRAIALARELQYEPQTPMERPALDLAKEIFGSLPIVHFIRPKDNQNDVIVARGWSRAGAWEDFSSAELTFLPITWTRFP